MIRWLRGWVPCPRGRVPFRPGRDRCRRGPVLLKRIKCRTGGWLLMIFCLEDPLIHRHSAMRMPPVRQNMWKLNRRAPLLGKSPSAGSPGIWACGNVHFPQRSTRCRIVTLSEETPHAALSRDRLVCRECKHEHASTKKPVEGDEEKAAKTMQTTTHTPHHPHPHNLDPQRTFHPRRRLETWLEIVRDIQPPLDHKVQSVLQH